ncbi:MAG: hypothetical protein WAO91_07210 [Candidatus Nitrosotenuis sp.]
MTTYDEYLRGVLQQIDDSYTILSNLKDKPGDLEIIKRDLAKISGLAQALSNKLISNKQEYSDYQHLLLPLRFFLENHHFFRELDTMSSLYSDDPMRLKNMRLTILDALDEKNLMGHIKAILRERT